MTRPVKIAVLLSGGGTTMEIIIAHINERNLPAVVDFVVSSRHDAYGLVRARNHGIESAVIPSAEYRRSKESGKGTPDWVAMSKAINDILLPRMPDLICFAGFMCKYVVPDCLIGKVMNIHPALIPSFCGKGMYGHHVHEAVVAAGVKVSGCTVHFVNNEYDAGPIIVQRSCPVYDSDTPDAVASRVFAEECEAYPEAIRLFAEGRLRIEGAIVRILQQKEGRS